MQRIRILTIALLALLAAGSLGAVPVAAIASAEESLDESLTRGSRFTVTITGLPNTTYYVWLPHTHTMSGEQYDQPPVIADYTENFQKDSAGGPYTIGSYQYYNGNGRTILDDVAPSTATSSCTDYYGQVRTTSNGQAVVGFLTSVYTGLRSYSVRVENPTAPDDGRLSIDIDVQARRAPTMSIIAPEPTTRATTAAPVVTTTPPPTTVPPPETTPAPERTPVPVQTAVPTTRAAAGVYLVPAALLAALVLVMKRR